MATQPDAAVAEPACAGGAACAALGLQASDRQEHAAARALLERACALNDARGCKWLALDLDHERGDAAHAEPARAQTVMHKACDLSELEACRMLAVGYLYGNRPGVTVDAQRAVTLFKTACDGGEAASCEGLANCYAEGTGVAKDKKLAKQYRKRAAELGFVGE